MYIWLFQRESNPEKELLKYFPFMKLSNNNNTEWIPTICIPKVITEIKKAYTIMIGYRHCLVQVIFWIREYITKKNIMYIHLSESGPKTSFIE